MRRRTRTGLAAAPLLKWSAMAATLIVLGAWPVAAEDFYAGKQITLIVGAGVGGGYDLQARLTARHLGRHVPGHPGIIVQNMPAAGGIAATNHTRAPRPRTARPSR